LRQPSSDFLRDPYFYIKYDLTWFTLLAAPTVAMWLLGWRGLGLSWGPHLLAYIAGASFLAMFANASVHNCSHGNWPKPINRLLGELFGLIVLTRYASWEILHRRHHMFSDDAVKDPHPVELSFWGFLWRKMLLNLEKNLHQQAYELWGDTPAVRRRELVRSWVSVSAGAALFAFWFVVLGPVGFFGIFVPSMIFGVLHLTHFNWSTHNGPFAKEERDLKPVNLDHGVYWVLNRLLFGAYFHANHHAYATVFNPRHLDPARAAKVEGKIDRILERVRG
jgi:stearoyl-CoA desaturase (delta-9 desaturase)